MDEAEANAIYDILTAHAGAPAGTRPDFVQAHTENLCDEYRFIGNLGFGGKYWRHRQEVTAYPEDVQRQPEIGARVAATNRALAALFTDMTAHEHGKEN